MKDLGKAVNPAKYQSVEIELKQMIKGCEGYCVAVRANGKMHTLLLLLVRWRLEWVRSCAYVKRQACIAASDDLPTICIVRNTQYTVLSV